MTEKPNNAKGSKVSRSGETARELIRKTKRATRRKFPSEEKIRIVIEGMRGEVSVAELCRREGIHPTIYYKWLKEFMEAGKSRLRGGFWESSCPRRPWMTPSTGLAPG